MHLSSFCHVSLQLRSVHLCLHPCYIPALTLSRMPELYIPLPVKHFPLEFLPTPKISVILNDSFPAITVSNPTVPLIDFLKGNMEFIFLTSILHPIVRYFLEVYLRKSHFTLLYFSYHHFWHCSYHFFFQSIEKTFK